MSRHDPLTPAETDAVADLGLTAISLRTADLLELSVRALEAVADGQALAAQMAADRARAFSELFRLLLPWLDEGDTSLLPALRRAGEAGFAEDRWYFGARYRQALDISTRCPDLLDPT